MTLEVRVHGLVPRSPVRPEALTVPPVIVERSISEPQHLGQGVQEGLEEREEARKPYDERDGRKLQEPLQDHDKVQRGNLIQRILQNGRRILEAREPDECAEAADFTYPLHHKDPSNLVGARIDRLIHERRCPPKVDKIAECDVVWIGALRVEVGDELSFGRMQESVAEIAIGERVGSRLQ